MYGRIDTFNRGPITNYNTSNTRPQNGQKKLGSYRTNYKQEQPLAILKEIQPNWNIDGYPYSIMTKSELLHLTSTELRYEDYYLITNKRLTSTHQAKLTQAIKSNSFNAELSKNVCPLNLMKFSEEANLDLQALRYARIGSISPSGVNRNNANNAITQNSNNNNSYMYQNSSANNSSNNVFMRNNTNNNTNTNTNNTSNNSQNGINIFNRNANTNNNSNNNNSNNNSSNSSNNNSNNVFMNNSSAGKTNNIFNNTNNTSAGNNQNTNTNNIFNNTSNSRTNPNNNNTNTNATTPNIFNGNSSNQNTTNGNNQPNNNIFNSNSSSNTNNNNNGNSTTNNNSSSTNNIFSNNSSNNQNNNNNNNNGNNNNNSNNIFSNNNNSGNSSNNNNNNNGNNLFGNNNNNNNNGNNNNNTLFNSNHNNSQYNSNSLYNQQQYNQQQSTSAFNPYNNNQSINSGFQSFLQMTEYIVGIFKHQNQDLQQQQYTNNNNYLHETLHQNTYFSDIDSFHHKWRRDEEETCVIIIKQDSEDQRPRNSNRHSKYEQSKHETEYQHDKGQNYHKFVQSRIISKNSHKMGNELPLQSRRNGLNCTINNSTKKSDLHHSNKSKRLLSEKLILSKVHLNVLINIKWLDLDARQSQGLQSRLESEIYFQKIDLESEKGRKQFIEVLKVRFQVIRKDGKIEQYSWNRRQNIVECTIMQNAINLNEKQYTTFYTKIRDSKIYDFAICRFKGKSNEANITWDDPIDLTTLDFSGNSSFSITENTYQWEIPALDSNCRLSFKLLPDKIKNIINSTKKDLIKKEASQFLTKRFQTINKKHFQGKQCFKLLSVWQYGSWCMQIKY